MSITITAFARSPDGGRGLARDMPVRWALEEVGQPYGVRLVTFDEMKEAPHVALQPFGQIPTYEEGDLHLFESGAIVLHIGARHGGLLPADADARARVATWLIAAIGTVEPPIVERETAIMLEGGESWHEHRLPMLDDRVRRRLAALSLRLGDAEWLEDGFTAADLMMIAVLRRLGGSDLLEEHENLAAYVARGEARPAYRRAFAAQKAVSDSAGAVGG